VKLRAIKSSYENGALTKADYIAKMYNIHGRLFEYSEFLNDTDIAQIVIQAHEVMMVTRTRGVKMICAPADQRSIPVEIINFGVYEADELQMILELIGDDFNILDIGANIGWYSLNIAKTKPTARIWAFEPIPRTFAYLQQNIELNQLSNIQIYNFGFSNQNQELPFYYYPEGSVNAALTNLADRSNVQKIKCLVKRLDDFIAASNLKVDFIKCDVEGAELFVFQGGVATLERHRPIIFTEMLRKWSAKFDYHPNELIELFRRYNYRCFVLSDGKLNEIGEMTDQTSETNFFFLHAQKHERIIETRLA
jgi:FkbM family methyltransferase